MAFVTWSLSTRKTHLVRYKVLSITIVWQIGESWSFEDLVPDLTVLVSLL